MTCYFTVAGKTTFAISLKKLLPSKILNHYTKLILGLELLIRVSYDI